MKRIQEIIRIVFRRILSVVVVLFTVSDGNALAQSNSLDETGYGHDTTCRPVLFVKTNLLYDMLTFVNASVEVPLAKKLTAEATIVYPWWRDNWFTLTSKTNGKSIKIPGTHYLDNSDYVNQALTSSVYLQSSTIGTSTSEPKQYAFNINYKAIGDLASGAGRATGLMIRPVKYVRVN